MSEEVLLRRQMGRAITNLYNSFQDLRKNAMNQIRDIVRKKNEGIAFDEVEEKKEKKEFDKKYKDNNLDEIAQQLLEQGKFTKEEFDFFSECRSLVKGFKVRKMPKCKHCERRSLEKVEVGGITEIEEKARKMMKEYVEPEPIWKMFLSKIRGISYVLAAKLIKEIGYCQKAETVSQLWAYTGNHVVNGKAPKRQKGQKLGYNTQLLSLTWLVSSTLLRSNHGYYQSLYYEEKERQLEKQYPQGHLAGKYNGYEDTDTSLTKLHAHNRALRKMRKHFLAHYWEAARESLGLSTEKTYVEGVLEHDHIVGYREAIRREE